MKESITLTNDIRTIIKSASPRILQEAVSEMLCNRTPAKTDIFDSQDEFLEYIDRMRNELTHHLQALSVASDESWAFDWGESDEND